METLTTNMENYLEAVYELSRGKSYARVSDIAERLSVSKASASSAMQTLMEKGLITTEKYRQVYLTEKGLRLAELISGKHVIIKKFFIDVLAVAPDIADTDACAIEHVISSDSISAMERFLEERDLK